jgi:hypothetical protein
MTTVKGTRSHRKVGALITVFVIIAVISIGLIAYQVSVRSDLTPKCLAWQKSILAEQGSVSSAELSFQASDFNAKCSDYIPPGEQLQITSGQ